MQTDPVAVTIAANPRALGRPRLAIWSLRLALGGGALAVAAAVAGATVPPAWYVQSVGPSAAMPTLALLAATSLVVSLGACVAALIVGILALIRGQRVWQVILAVVIVVTLYPTIGALYFVLGLFLYD